MNYINEIYIILLKIIISNDIIVYTHDELSQNTKNHKSITIDDLNTLIRKYPAFIKLTLQTQNCYIGKDISCCPMPYNENTLLDDPDLVQSKCLNPRECKKPGTQKNEIDDSIRNVVEYQPSSNNSTICQKLGNIITSCLKDNTNIIQCYTHYLNVMESVGLTLVDRFCLYEIELWNRLEKLEVTVDFNEDFSLFAITINLELLTVILKNFKKLLKNISIAFKHYNISTVPLNCVSNIIKNMTLINKEFNDLKYNEQFIECRKLMKSKKIYAVLDNDEYWEWDVTSDGKPDDNLMILIQYRNSIMGLNLFANKQK